MKCMNARLFPILQIFRNTPPSSHTEQTVYVERLCTEPSQKVEEVKKKKKSEWKEQRAPAPCQF